MYRDQKRSNKEEMSVGKRGKEDYERKEIGEKIGDEMRDENMAEKED